MIVEQQADALIASDDYLAAQIINCLNERGYKLPDDVAIVGNGNRQIANYTRPMLTTIDFKIDVVAQRSVDILIKMINNERKDKSVEQVMIAPELVIRKSA